MCLPTRASRKKVYPNGKKQTAPDEQVHIASFGMLVCGSNERGYWAKSSLQSISSNSSCRNEHSGRSNSNVILTRQKCFLSFVAQSECRSLYGKSSKKEKKRKKEKNKGAQSKARAGWPTHLRLVRATPWAHFAVITAQLWSTIIAIFLWVNNFAFNCYLQPRSWDYFGRLFPGRVLERPSPRCLPTLTVARFAPARCTLILWLIMSSLASSTQVLFAVTIISWM